MSRVFLSHTSVDKPFVERLAQDLMKMGIEVWYDKWEIKVGDSILWKIEEGIKESDYLIIVISKEAWESKWVQTEIEAAYNKQLQIGTKFILPIYYKECEIPLFFRGIKYADFRTDYADGLQELAKVFDKKPLLPEKPPVAELCSAGLLYLYLNATRDGEQIFIQQVSTSDHAFDFCEQVDELRKEQKETDVELFCVLGVTEKVDEIAELLEGQIKKNFKQILNGEELLPYSEAFDCMGQRFEQAVMEHIFRPDAVRFPRHHYVHARDWSMYCIWAGEGAEDESHLLIDDVVDTWLEYEKPMLMGKQLLNQPFQLADLTGRKIIGVYPDPETKQWCVLLESGLKLHLEGEIPYMREKAGIRDFGVFTISDLDGILNNPVYAYDKWLAPTELYEEWHKVFLYAMAVQNREWKVEELRFYFERFLDFMEEHVCEVIPAKAHIGKELFYNALMRYLTDLRGFLQGKDSPVISKDFWILLNTRYVYLPHMYRLLDVEPETMGKAPQPFNAATLKELVKVAQIDNTYQKGIGWEDAVEYFMSHIPGFQVSGHRVRAIDQEIDLSVVNVSLDGALWEMGAYLLIECKNWASKVDISVIRGLAHIAELKGNKTTILFATNGITKQAESEILRVALNGKYIICITKKELLRLKSDEDCYRLLITKWKNLQESVENQFMI